MSIPDYPTIMLPLLEYAGSGDERSFRGTVESLSERFKLSTSEREELLSSGRQALFDNRVGWARTYLVKAGLLVSTRRGYFKITDRGSDVLKEQPKSIDVKYLSIRVSHDKKHGNKGWVAKAGSSLPHSFPFLHRWCARDKQTSNQAITAHRNQLPPDCNGPTVEQPSTPSM